MGVLALEEKHEACKNDAILRYEEDAKKEAGSYETKREELIAHIEVLALMLSKLSV